MERPEESSDKFYSICGSILLTVSALGRFVSYPISTSDYTYFVSKWFIALQNHPGLTAFRTPFSDYSPLYLYFLKLLTYIPIPSLYSVKTLSILFDIAMALVVCTLVRKSTNRLYTRAKLFFVFAIMFSIPTLVINSSLWGQSDAIYALGILVCVYYILQNRPLAAILVFSLAFSVKLQAVFFLPVLVGYCLRKESSAGYLIFIPLIYFLSIIPARLGGGSLSDLLLVYARESGEYTSLSVSAPNVFTLFNHYQFLDSAQHILFLGGILLAGFCSVTIAAYVFYKRNMSTESMVRISLFCVLLLPYVLPRMHERYFYLADVLSVVYSLINPKYWYIPVLIVGSSLLSYIPYLSQVSWFSHLSIDLRIPSLLLVTALAVLSRHIVRREIILPTTTIAIPV